MTADQKALVESATQAAERALERAKLEKTAEARQAAIDAWQIAGELVRQFAPKKRAGFASRAGQRQAAERRALHSHRR